MAFLPTEPLTLTGGCHCNAIRYTIAVPALSERPLIPGALPTPTCRETNTTVPTRLPLIDLDHCTSCRRTSGALLQCWFICPQDWVTFTLQPRDPPSSSSSNTVITPPTSTAAGHPPSSPSSPPISTTTYLTHYPSSPHVRRSFCSRCGTNLTWANIKDRGPEWRLGAIVDVAVGTLDRESLEQVRPDRHGWWDDGVEWVRRLVTEGDGGLIRHPGGSDREEVKVEYKGEEGERERE